MGVHYKGTRINERDKRMFGFGARKRSYEEEELCCRYCEYATVTEERVFCKKKKAERQESDHCSAFAYDLLKRRPGEGKGKRDLSDLEFPVI